MIYLQTYTFLFRKLFVSVMFCIFFFLISGTICFSQLVVYNSGVVSTIQTGKGIGMLHKELNETQKAKDAFNQSLLIAPDFLLPTSNIKDLEKNNSTIKKQ